MADKKKTLRNIIFKAYLEKENIINSNITFSDLKGDLSLIKEKYYSSNFYSDKLKNLKKLLSGMYKTVNGLGIFDESNVNTKLEANVYFECLALALIGKQEGLDSDKNVNYKRFLSKLRNANISEITESEKMEFLKRITYELARAEPPKNFTADEWEREVKEYYQIQYDNILISSKEKEFKKILEDLFNEYFGGFYNNNNGGSIIFLSEYINNLFKENIIENHISVNKGNGNPWLEILDLDDRLIIIDELKRRTADTFKQFQTEIAKALYIKLEDSNVNFSELIQKNN